jgi:hypothetical protein
MKPSAQRATTPRATQLFRREILAAAPIGDLATAIAGPVFGKTSLLPAASSRWSRADALDGVGGDAIKHRQFGKVAIDIGA